LDEEEMTPIRKQFGFLFQGAALFDSMTLYDNVAFPLREERRPEAEIQKRVNEALCIVDLTQAQDKKAGRTQRRHAQTRGFGARRGGQSEIRALR
jgi:ABC-type transporter Mla maintaining outer membrane lipid asymmetry ATPase subunit MlaF